MSDFNQVIETSKKQRYKKSGTQGIPIKNPYNVPTTKKDLIKQKLGSCYYLSQLTVSLNDDFIKMIEKERIKISDYYSYNDLLSMFGDDDEKNRILYKIELLRKNVADSYRRVLRFIDSIDDGMIKAIMTYRYINNYSWAKVGNKLGNNTPDCVRMAFNRWLDQLIKNNDKSIEVLLGD